MRNKYGLELQLTGLACPAQRRNLSSYLHCQFFNYFLLLARDAALLRNIFGSSPLSQVYDYSCGQRPSEASVTKKLASVTLRQGFGLHPSLTRRMARG